MSKNAIIFHGTDCTPTDYWYSWLGVQLKARDYNVDIPSYPSINHEPIDSFITSVLSAHTFDDETVIIGHSSGAPLLLSILERIDVVVAQAILVAGYARIRPNDQSSTEPVLQHSYDWERIKAHSSDFIYINSVNDPWGCNDVEGRYMFDHLGGTLIVMNEGHFGSTSFSQPYKKFPLLQKLIQ